MIHVYNPFNTQYWESKTLKVRYNPNSTKLTSLYKSNRAQMPKETASQWVYHVQSKYKIDLIFRVPILESVHGRISKKRKAHNCILFEEYFKITTFLRFTNAHDFDKLSFWTSCTTWSGPWRWKRTLIFDTINVFFLREICCMWVPWSNLTIDNFTS